MAPGKETFNEPLLVGAQLVLRQAEAKCLLHLAGHGVRRGGGRGHGIRRGGGPGLGVWRPGRSQVVAATHGFVAENTQPAGRA